MAGAFTHFILCDQGKFRKRAGRQKTNVRHVEHDDDVRAEDGRRALQPARQHRRRTERLPRQDAHRAGKKADGELAYNEEGVRKYGKPCHMGFSIHRGLSLIFRTIANTLFSVNIASSHW